MLAVTVAVFCSRTTVLAVLLPAVTVTGLAVVGAVPTEASTTNCVCPLPPISVSRPPPVFSTVGPVKVVTSMRLSPAPPVSSAASIPLKVLVTPPTVSVVAPRVISASALSTKVSKPPPPSMLSAPGPPVSRSSPPLPMRVSLPAPPSRTTEAMPMAAPVKVLPLASPANSPRNWAAVLPLRACT